jgi:REP-associated tyrosine transposase
MVFHVLNRGVGRRTLFGKDADYIAFMNVFTEAMRTRPMRVCAYCVLPNHWHMVLWPKHDGDLPAFMQQLTNTHVKRWKEHYHENGYGHLYQGRYKSFPVQTEEYFYNVVHYVERNPVRAKLVEHAELWPWSSRGLATSHEGDRPALAPWPVPFPADWLNLVNSPQSEQEVERLRKCVNHGCPLGDADWVETVAERLGLQHTLRPRGRPRASK